MKLEPSVTAKLCCLSLRWIKELVYPGYAGYNARPHAFATWPKSMPQTKGHLEEIVYKIGTQDDFCKEQTKW